MSDMILGLVLIVAGVLAIKHFSSVRDKHYQEYINRRNK